MRILDGGCHRVGFSCRLMRGRNEIGTMGAYGRGCKLHCAGSGRRFAERVRREISSESLHYRGLESKELPGCGISRSVLLARRRGIAWDYAHSGRRV